MISQKFAKLICKLSNFVAVNAQINAANIGYHSLNKYNNIDCGIINLSELKYEFRNKIDKTEFLLKKLSKNKRIRNGIIAEVSCNYNVKNGIVVSKNMKIVDGHHRYLIFVENYGPDFEIEVKQIQFNFIWIRIFGWVFLPLVLLSICIILPIIIQVLFF
jgi:hypothetical protein